MRNAPSLELPGGFHCSAIHAGIGKKKDKPDLTLFYSETPCGTAALFTTNLVKAAPVLISRKHAGTGRTRAILANSGCANACTGKRGFTDAYGLCRLTARLLNVKTSEVLAASTGVIGAFLPVQKARSGIQELSKKIRSSSSANNHSSGNSVIESVRAIMTTDTVPKIARQTLNFGSGKVNVWGCAKGAGMIAPRMATMLSFILTDAQIPKPALQKMLKSAAADSFNILSVDSDTSTNDSVFLLANGASGVSVSSRSDSARFQNALNGLCLSLAKQMAADGEGATKRIEIQVKGAADSRSARVVARTVADSPLVKTAFFGRDANWGRIIAAVGRSGVNVDPDRIEISFNGLCVARKGAAVPFSEQKAKQILSGKVVQLTIHLHQGQGKAQFLTCDFSLDYIKINASYRS